MAKEFAWAVQNVESVIMKINNVGILKITFKTGGRKRNQAGTIITLILHKSAGNPDTFLVSL